MLSKLARGAVLLVLAVMVVAWVVSAGKSKPAEPKPGQAAERWYS